VTKSQVRGSRTLSKGKRGRLLKSVS
jgi:hypothetical protein